MENGSHPYYFYLTMYKDQRNIRYVYFTLVLILYLVILCLNISITLVIILDKMLHQPMYILIACLSVNSIYGATGLLPKMLTDLLLNTHAVSRSACFLQILVVYTYGSYEFTILTLMAYDRHVAICEPLKYHSIMTARALTIMVAVALIYPLCAIGSNVSLAFRLPLCGNELRKLYCSNWSVVQLSCVDTTLNNIVGMIITVVTVFLPLFFILYSYINILVICQRKSSDFKRKAMHTCLPHIVTFVNYSIAVFCEIIFSRYDLPDVVAVILSLEFLIIPPVLNPLVYGLNFLEIHRRIIIFLTPLKMSMTPD
ncbi:putative gustatory receptor clone PTE03 [Alosa sapidissima]|uniref:putative gustatory receptor clone PTE03 n=1 Tax=Alosa sapidissima TaxID=34773 RepID=UPI001C0A5B6D|nr:putative gustatory receptor clone PTE03 [Alosa sapidissima]